MKYKITKNIKIVSIILLLLLIIAIVNFTFATHEVTNSELPKASNDTPNDIFLDEQKNYYLEDTDILIEDKEIKSLLEPSNENDALDLINIDPSNKESYDYYGKYVKVKNLNEIHVFTDGQRINFEKYDNVNPILEDGRTLIPLRAVSESLGAELEWDPINKKIIITYEDKNLILQLDSKIATINGTKTTLDVPAKSINGRTLVPIRFISENFGKKVEWFPYSSNLKIIYIY
jgi:biopolymer transport protein ExbD